MGEGVQERRSRSINRRCAWCGRIEAGTGWRAERRQSPPTPTDGVCPRCLERLLRGDAGVPGATDG
jgi:hypothetical protein